MKTETVFYGTGRRKTAVARVWIFKGQKGFSINGQTSLDYLKRESLEDVVMQPLRVSSTQDQFRVRARVEGGGIAGQAGAIQLGIARALLEFNEQFRAELRKNGLLTRDPREKERKKAGRKGARRSFQYTKR